MDRKIHQSIISVLFGEWNGIQFFLLPMTLFYLLDGFSIARWITGLLTHRIHYLPLTVFLFFFLFHVYMILKRLSYDFELPASKYKRKDLISFIIKIHEQLIIFILVMAIVYVFSAFIRYFYQIQMPIRYAFAYITQFCCITLIVFHYVMNNWLFRFRIKGHSYNRAWAYMFVYVKRNLGVFIQYSLLCIMMIVVSIYVYRIMIVILISPLFSYISDLTGWTLKIRTQNGSSGLIVVSNVWSVFVAYLISNLFYAPIVKAFHGVLQMFHPLTAKKEPNAKS